MSTEELLSNIRVKKIHFRTKKIETETFDFFSISLRRRHNEKRFKWKLNKSVDDIFTLQKSLKPFSSLIPLEKSLPSKRVFLRLPNNEDRIAQLHSFLTFILSPPIPCRYLLEFLEVSLTSFTFSDKQKEGYVYKYGSGRRTNRKRCFNFCNKVFGKKKMWLRILPDGIEYSKTNESSSVVEVIHFCKEFKVEYGWNATEFICGVNISTSQHKFLFLTENLRVRDEFVEEIKKNFGKSEFTTANIQYNSSFVVRQMNGAKWYVDGNEFYSDVCDYLRKAQVAVCITDWWLSPELYLKRPVEAFSNCRLIDILGEIADRGVKIYVLLYKELTFTIGLNSLYSKKTLQSRSPNIKVIRHPTMSIRGGEFLWSHHSKIVCVDNIISFIGGLDLCYGRWDTPEHKMSDFEGQMWPGIDYSNVRVADFIKVDNWQEDRIDRNSIPRMPWHDIAVSVKGLVVKDVWNHFIQLWNHIIKDITGSKDKGKIMNFANTLVLSPDGEIDKRLIQKQETLRTTTQKVKELIQKIEPEEGSESLREIKEQFYKQKLSSQASNFIIHSKEENEAKADSKGFNFFKAIKHHVEQNVRKKSESIESIPETPPILEENQSGEKKFDIRKMMQHYITKNSFLTPYPNQRRMNRLETGKLLAQKQKEEKDDFEITQALSEKLDNMDGLIELSKRASGDYLNRSDKQNIDCQIVRSAGLWSLGRKNTEDSIHNAYQSLIIGAKRFIYIENQFFISNSAGKPVLNTIAEVLIKRINMAIMCSENFRVVVMIPLLPAFEGSVDDPTAAVLRVQLHYEYKTICRGKKSIINQLKKVTPYPEKYIRFYSLRTHDVLNNQPVTEMIYIHSKLMIVDDTTVIVGSANINDRSLLGDRDAEICLVINDNEPTSVRYGEELFTCSKFAYSFRTNIFKEHSGCKSAKKIENPFSDQFTKKWDNRAATNTKMYRKIFACYPDDNIQTLPEVKSFAENAKKSLYFKKCKKIKGNIVEFPMNFLKNEDLNITVKQKEFLLPDITFT